MEIKLLYIDLFCGAGGTSTGVEAARIRGRKCAKVIACVNHDANAIASHAANHPGAVHFTEDIRTLDIRPLKELADRQLKRHSGAKLVLWASLECTNFSRAKGGKPRDPDSRTLAEHLIRYVAILNPDYIQIENVEEFMAWGPLNEHGRPVSRLQGCDYLRWVDNVCSYGYSYSYRIINAADHGAYTSRKRYFGLFAKHGLAHNYPEATYSKQGKSGDNLFNDTLRPWKAVLDVLDIEDEGENIFIRKRPLVENTLKRIYAGLVKFAGNGNENFTIRYNQVKPEETVKSVECPCGVLTAENRFGLVKCVFLCKNYSGHDSSKNISTKGPAGTVTARDHHALITYYKHGSATGIDKPAPTVTPKDRIAKLTFLANEYSGGGQVSDVNAPCPTLLGVPKQKLVECFLMNPQYRSAGGSVHTPCFTLVARMDKVPPYLVTTTKGETGIAVFEDDSPMTVKIKEFMAANGISEIKMRMLKVSELKAIMGFPTNYVLKGTISEQKKFIGNAVEVNMSRRLCEALAETI